MSFQAQLSHSVNQLHLLTNLILTTNSRETIGMAKAVADVEGENQGGYGSDYSKITGFSHMHDSGTGGVTSLGNFPIFPLAGCPNDSLDNCTFPQPQRNLHQINGTVEAHPGYFALTLESNIRAEMTVSNHTALYRFTFPEKPAGFDAPLSPVIFAELSDLPHSQSATKVNYTTATGRMTGEGTFVPSFGTGHYQLRFCADFSGAELRDVGAWDRGGAVGYAGDDGNYEPPFVPHGAFARFHAPEGKRQILARVGVSFISQEQACANAEREIPDFDFEGTLKIAEGAWREKLGVIEVDDKGVSESLKRVFWSGLYRSFISPQDYTGENYLWESTEPYYDSFYCIWDSFRAQHPLLMLMDPHQQARMVRSLIDTWRHEGFLPDCRMSLCQGWSQGGSNADVVLADSYVKGLYEGYDIDWDAGYQAVWTDAEEEPSRWDLHGRGGLASWKNKGYIPIGDKDSLGFGPRTRSVSRTVEYAYNDYSIAQIARGRGNMTDYDKYMQSSNNWKNLLKVNQTTLLNGTDVGFVGVLQPKNYDSTWHFQDPLLCSPLIEPNACYLTMDGHETYEGSCWLYTFFVPGDTAGLIQALDNGDRKAFIRRLDFLHESGILYMGDEQAFLTTFQYHYAGRPGLSAQRAHYYIPSQFNDTLVGIPGNDDSGAMGAYASLSMMGIFPNAGQNVYFIIPPFFREVRITSPQTGKTATIRNRNFDPNYKRVFIQKAYLNGQEYENNWIDHGFFLDGGLLELVLGGTESDWGTRDEDCPPSLSTTGSVNGTWVSLIQHFLAAKITPAKKTKKKKTVADIPHRITQRPHATAHRNHTQASSGRHRTTPQ
jgi:putative alpha-1,2-mannosidase